MSYQLTGKIKSIGETKQVSDSFKVRDFVVTIEDGKYPQVIQLQTSNDKCDSLNAFTTGSDVTVSFNLRGREWTNPQGEVKIFNTIDAWKIDGATAGTVSAPAQSQTPASQTPVPQNGDDLPF